MKNICDFSIIQRDADGFGRAVYKGTAELYDNILLVARVVNEETGIQVVPWQKCELKGNEWSVELTIPQGGLYRVEVRHTNAPWNPDRNAYDWANYAAMARHVGVGDIYILAGQSNMSGYAKEPAFDPPELGVHLFDNSGNWCLASQPLACSINPIYPNNDPAAGNSPGLSFGKALKRALGIPIGLVMAALGGSSLERWNPAESEPYLYESMMQKFEQVGKIAGIAWYQGCNETNEEECYSYLEKFTQAVSLWRNKMGPVPIVTCQLNRHANQTESNELCWAHVKEAQRKAAMTIKDVYVVSTVDMPTCDGIHNNSGACITIGERMAAALLKCHYSLAGYTSPTILKAEKTEKDKVFLQIDSGHILKTMDDRACGMYIEDEKGMMNCTEVTVCENGLTVTGEREICGKAFFHAYCFKEQPAFHVRDLFGSPILACYGVEIE